MENEKREIKKDIIKLSVSAVLLILAIILDSLLSADVFISLLLYLPSYITASYSVFNEVIENIKEKEIFSENLLMTIASLGAFSIAFLPGGSKEFSEGVFVMLFFGVGELFEEIAERKSEESVKHLTALTPETALRKNGLVQEEIKCEDIKVNDILIIMPGDKIPADGIITEGESSVNTSALTGESIPLDVKEGDEVFSGSININGMIKLKVTKEYDDSFASKILEMTLSASKYKTKKEKFITKFSKIYTPIVVILALLTAFLPPLFSSDFNMEFTKHLHRALSFLIISCPCALILSVPLTFVCALGCASKNGILIKGADKLEAAIKCKTCVFDKTGTLTKGIFKISKVSPQNTSEKELLHLAHHAESYSKHPIALSLKNEYKEKCSCEVKDAKEIPGKGLVATVNGEKIYVGNKSFMHELGINFKEEETLGNITYVAKEKLYLGNIEIKDEIKEDAKDTLKALEEKGIKTAMLTGDKYENAKETAESSGIKEYFFSLLPQDKLNKLESIIENKNDNSTVIYVGDGINDTPVLSRADIGIAMGALGSKSALEIADIVITDDRLSKIPLIIKIAEKSVRIAKENIFIALFVKILILILSFIGITNMYLAIFADVGITLLLIVNASRCLKIKQK